MACGRLLWMNTSALLTMSVSTATAPGFLRSRQIERLLRLAAR